MMVQGVRQEVIYQNLYTPHSDASDIDSDSDLTGGSSNYDHIAHESILM